MKKIIITNDYLELAVESGAFTEDVEVGSRIFVDLFLNRTVFQFLFFVVKPITTPIIVQ